MSNAQNDFEAIELAFQLFKKQYRIPEVFSAEVVSYSSPNVVVKLAGSEVEITLPNLTNQTLTTGDYVEVMTHGDLTSAFVAFKRP